MTMLSPPCQMAISLYGQCTCIDGYPVDPAIFVGLQGEGKLVALKESETGAPDDTPPTPEVE